MPKVSELMKRIYEIANDNVTADDDHIGWEREIARAAFEHILEGVDKLDYLHRDFHEIRRFIKAEIARLTGEG